MRATLVMRKKSAIMAPTIAVVLTTSVLVFALPNQVYAQDGPNNDLTSIPPFTGHEAIAISDPAANNQHGAIYIIIVPPHIVDNHHLDTGFVNIR